MLYSGLFNPTCTPPLVHDYIAHPRMACAPAKVLENLTARGLGDFLEEVFSPVYGPQVAHEINAARAQASCRQVFCSGSSLTWLTEVKEVNFFRSPRDFFVCLALDSQGIGQMQRFTP